MKAISFLRSSFMLYMKSNYGMFESTADTELRRGARPRIMARIPGGPSVASCCTGATAAGTALSLSACVRWIPS